MQSLRRPVATDLSR